MGDVIKRALRHVRRAVLAIGSTYHKRVALMNVGSFREPLRVNGRTRFNKDTHLGRNTNFNGLTVIGSGRLTIGDNFHSGSECLIITSFHDYDHGDAIPYGATSVERSVDIGDNVWLGSRVTILGGVSLGEGCIIQAGAVVVSDVEPYAIVGGNPAKQFKRRNIVHYTRLKAEGKFH